MRETASESGVCMVLVNLFIIPHDPRLTIVAAGDPSRLHFKTSPSP